MGEQDLRGQYIIGISSVSGSTININQYIGKSAGYHQMLEELNDREELLSCVPDNDIAKRLKLSQKVEDLRKKIESFKKDVQDLADSFNKIEINTERLRNAKELFDNGHFKASYDLLRKAEPSIASEQKELLAAKEHKQRELQVIEEDLKKNAAEYLIFAKTTALDYENHRRFEDACDRYRQSILSWPSEENIFIYAAFLGEHNQFLQAIQLYDRLLKEFGTTLSDASRSAVLNNLALLHLITNQLEQAAVECGEALSIRRKLAEENPRADLPDVAMTLNNLAALHADTNQLEQAEEEYGEALSIRRKLAEENPRAYLPDVATTLNNLAVLHSSTNQLESAAAEYGEALSIYRKLVEENPRAYLPDVATVLNNLAALHVETNQLEQAEEELREALTIHRNLAEENPRAYLPDVAMILNNLALLHADTNQLEQAEEELGEALSIRRKLAEENPRRTPTFLR